MPQFFADHPVFRLKDLSARLESQGSSNPATRQALLAYHIRQGHIMRIRRGLYASVPLGTPAGEHRVNPIHVAAKATDDAVLGYKTALDLHLGDPPTGPTLTYLTAMSLGRPFEFQGKTYRGTLQPKALQDAGIENLGVTTRTHNGLRIRVTSAARTLVDILDRPILAARWAQIWPQLSRLPALDGEQLLEYVLALGNATTAAKVGFFLTQRRPEVGGVTDPVLGELRELRPSSPHYMDRLYGSEGRLVNDWNLIVPTRLLEAE